MWLWGFFAVVFALTTLVLAYFSWFPEQLLALHEYLTGRDAARELDRATYSFMRMTRRLCAIPAVICLVIAACFVNAAVQAARDQPANDRHDQERFERIRKLGAGSLYSQHGSELTAPMRGPANPPAAPAGRPK